MLICQPRSNLGRKNVINATDACGKPTTWTVRRNPKKERKWKINLTLPTTATPVNAAI